MSNANYNQDHSTKQLLLLSALNSNEISRTILDIELDVNLSLKISLSTV